MAGLQEEEKKEKENYSSSEYLYLKTSFQPSVSKDRHSMLGMGSDGLGANYKVLQLKRQKSITRTSYTINTFHMH